MNILVLHGPNLNLLGQRKGDAPAKTLEWVDTELRRRADLLGANVKTVQSNHEGVLVDALQQARAWADAVLVSPGALALSGHVLRETLALVGKPAVEVQLARRKSVLKDVCRAQVVGKDPEVYFKGLERLVGKKAAAASATASASARTKAAPVKKTLGRKKPAQAPKPAAQKDSQTGSGRKSLGRVAAKTTPATPAADFLTRALVREKIAHRLSGKLTPSGLSTWARSRWLEVQQGGAAESGQRELLEDALQQLVLHAMPQSKLSDEQLVELMAQLSE